VTVMAEPSEVISAYKVESYLRKASYDAMEAEERTTLLECMDRLGMSTKEVIAILGKKVSARRKNQGTESTREFLMNDRIKDSRWEERKFRKERDDRRKELEQVLFLGPSGVTNKYKRIIAKIKEKVKTSRKRIRIKNKSKIDRTREKK
jgi:hypothetical protein